MTNTLQRRLGIIGAITAFIALGLLVDLQETVQSLLGFAHWVQGLGAVGLAAFVAAFVAWSLVLPKGPFVLLAGFIYGVGAGLAVVFVAATAAITAGFWIARSVGRARAAAWVARRPWLAACDRALEAQGARVVFLLRMSPIIPSQLQNYLYGLSRVRFGTCVVASWLGMLPFTALWVMTGAAMAHGGALDLDERLWWTLPVGVVVGVAALALVAWQARRTLRAVGIVAAPATVVLHDAA